MNVAIGIAGVALVLLTTIDAIWTTLWLEGHAGPITRRTTGEIRWLFRRVVGVGADSPATPRQHRRLSLTGPIVLTLSVLLWVVLLLAGWVAAFSASPTSLLQSHTHAPATLVDRIYYVGYSMFTLGNGDFGPNGGVWEMATVLAGMSGLVLITLAVTFLVAIIGAVVASRSFATQVFAIGDCGETFVINSWGGSGFPTIELQLISLTEQLNLVTEQHQAYPMLHYYHAEEEHRSVSAGIAVFDTALLLLERGIRRDCRPAPVALRVARAAVRGYLDTLRDVYVQPSDGLPPLPDLGRVRDAGLPVVTDAEFAGDIHGETERRRLLYALVENDRRTWPPGDA